MKHTSLLLLSALWLAAPGAALAQQLGGLAPFSREGEAAATRLTLGVTTFESPIPQATGYFGESTASVPDVNDDGVDDLLIGAPGETVGPLGRAGRAYVFSGADGSLLLSLSSPVPTGGGSFGRAVAGLPDVDGDGLGDLLIGAFLDGADRNGRAYVFSGANGDLIRTLESPSPDPGGNGYFGFAVAGVPDVGGDGISDFLVGAFFEDSGGGGDTGRVYLFDSATGEARFSVGAGFPEGHFGFAVAGVPDADGDGFGDVLIGAVSAGSGEAYLYSGATGDFRFRFFSPNFVADGEFGGSVAGVPDLDGDGRGDILIGAFSENGGADGAGRAYVFSGDDGSLIRAFASPDPQEGGRFGTVAAVPDLDLDGVPDVLVGAEIEGRAYAYSGATGALLSALMPPTPTDGFGVAVAGVPDLDGDGRGDLLVGSRFEDVDAEDAGRAYLFNGEGDGTNVPPLAVDDAAVTAEGLAVFIPVFRNDVDANGDALLVEGLGSPVGGSAEAVGDGIRYTPNPGFIGADSFTYTVSDGLGGSDLATVTVTVNEIPEDVRAFAAPDPGADDSFGIGVSSVPDVNADGVPDLLIGAADENGIETRGRAYLYDGATGDLLRTLQSPNPQIGSGFGISVAGIADVNGDGAGDLLIGAYLENESTGRAYLFSGATGTLLRTLESPSSEPSQFGWQVAAVSDTDGDAIEDLVVGSPGGEVYVFSGGTGLLLRTLEPPDLEVLFFGFGVAGLSDIDGDGRGEVIVGDAFGGLNDEGRAFIFSGATGELLRTLQSPNPDENGSFFGFPVAGIADVSGDGLDDVLVGAPFEDGEAPNIGRAYVYDSVTGDLIRTLNSPSPEAGGSFGIGLASVPDADGDEQEDILVGAWSETGENGRGGRAHLFSGATGALIRTLESPVDEVSGVFGRTVAGVPDLDGDGLGELLVGARGEDGAALNSGRAYLFLSGEGGNMPPVAAGDAAVTTAGVPVSIDVLANDSDPDGDPLSIASVGAPDEGTTEIVQEQVLYTPPPGFIGVASFVYTVSDGNDGTDGTDEALVTVSVLEGTPGLVTLTSPSEEGLGQFGRSVTTVPDADGDGRDDLLVGAPLEDGGLPDAGQAYLFSGTTGALLQTLESPNPEDSGFFGFTVAGVPDADGDGRGDLLIGAILEDNDSQDAGRAYLFSGATGLLLQALESPNFVQSGLFSSALAGVPDVDGDGRGDLLVGAPSENRGAENAGAAYLFSGATGLLLRALESPNPELGGQFGIAVESVADADGDGRGDLVVGAFREDAGAEDAGRAYVFSGATGAVLRSLVSSSPEAGGNFGASVAGVPDANGDGRGDVLIGSPLEDGGAENAGRAHLFSGGTGLLIRTLTSPNAELDGQFGISVSGVADVDGDQQGDFLVGAFLEDVLTVDAGRAYVFSGATGGALRTLESPNSQAEGFFGDTVVGVSDVDGDGRGDLLVSAPFEDSGKVADAGRAYLFLSGDGDLDITVTVESSAAPTAGNDLTLSVRVEGFSATTAELRYRPTGAPAFGTMPLAMQLDSYEGTIPGSDVTLRGLDYFVVLTDGETTVTFPELDPELNPLRLRTRVAQQASDVVLPSDAEYRMVSVPLVLDDPDPLAVFGDDYGDYGETSWRLLRHLPLAESYAEFPELNSDIVPGAGFWLAAYAEGDAPFGVENGLSVDASEPALITLPPGWSQIGNPFAFPVAWDAVLGSDLAQPPAAFDGSEYLLDQPVLDPWVGYFVLNDTEETVTLTVPPVEGGLPTRTAAKGSRAKGGEEDGYELHLHADVPARGLLRGLRDTQNVLGFADGAADGKDRLDLAEPPPITSHVRLSAVEDGVRLGHSFRPAGTDGAAWELELTASPDVLDAGPLTVRVALEEVGERPDGYDVHVLDLDAEAPLTLLEGAFELTLGVERPVRRLRLIAGTEAYADAARGGISLLPVAFALAPAYPNPFAGSATLAYELPEQADVVLDVFDLLGRRVAVLADGVQEAGRYAVRWDGTVAGAPAANGVYVYRLRAGRFTASQKMVLLR